MILIVMCFSIHHIDKTTTEYIVYLYTYWQTIYLGFAEIDLLEKRSVAGVLTKEPPSGTIRRIQYVLSGLLRRKC